MSKKEKLIARLKEKQKNISLNSYVEHAIKMQVTKDAVVLWLKYNAIMEWKC